MKQSTWLQNYEKEEKDKISNSKKKCNKKIVISASIVVIAIIIAYILDMIVYYIGDYLIITGIGMTIGLLANFAMINALRLLVGKLEPPKDLTPNTRKEVMALFQSDSDVEQFDREMSCASIKEFFVSSGTTLFMTEHYIGQKIVDHGYLRYLFIRKQDIASVKREKKRGDYFWVFIRNSEQELIMRIIYIGKKQLEEFTEMLAVENPGIIFDEEEVVCRSK